MVFSHSATVRHL